MSKTSFEKMEHQQIINKFEGINLLSLLWYFLIGFLVFVIPIWILGGYLYNNIKESGVSSNYDLLVPLFIMPVYVIIIIWLYDKLKQNKIIFKLLVNYNFSFHWLIVSGLFLIIFTPFYYCAVLVENKLILQFFTSNYYNFDYTAFEYNLTLLVNNILLFIIIGPIIEEIFWRGIIIHKYANKFGIKRTIVISSIIFSIIHLQKNYFIALFAFSIVLSILYLIARSLLVTFFCHAIYNAKTAIIPFFGIDDFKYFESLYDNYGNPYLLSLIFLLSIGLLVFFFYIVAARSNYKRGLPYFENEKEELAKTAPISCSSV